MGKPGGGVGGGGGGGTLPPSTILIRLKNINNIWAIIFYWTWEKFGCKCMKKRLLTKFFEQFLLKLYLLSANFIVEIHV